MELNISKVSIVCVLVGSLLFSCGKSVRFLPSSVVPGAEGKVKITTDKNKNYALEMNVNNLADPSRLEDPGTNYILWMETVENGTVNLGRVISSKPFLSKSRQGSFETVTPYKPLRFLITAEDQVDVQYPGTNIILRSEVYQ